MTLKSYVILTTLVLSCFPQLAIAQGNLVVNGSFDTNAAGWTLTNGASYNIKNGNPPGEVDFERFGGGATASQTINSLSPGVFYTVSGDYRGIAPVVTSTNYGFGVSLDGVFYFETTAPTNLDWYTFSFLYAATSSSTVLTLSQIDGNFYGIDNIAMYAVPEPSAISFILLGSGVLFYVRRRRHRI